MSNLVRPLAYIIIALLALILLVLAQAGPILAFFQENLVVNLMILLVFLFGITLSFWRLYSLTYEIDWLARIRSANQASNADSLAGPQVVRRLNLMAAFAKIWRRFFDSNQALTPDLVTILVDSAQARVDERRELSRYLITALVILGLLGTFWGLLGALISMREALSTLDPGQNLLTGLSQSLDAPLENMGTAFSSSLFGLAASLFFGFVELQTARAYNTFVEEFETWLASFIQGSADTTPSLSQGVRATTFAQDTAAKTSSNFESLAQLMRRGQHDTMVLNNNLVSLLDQVSRVADKLTADQSIHEKILAAQADQHELIAKLDALISAQAQALGRPAHEGGESENEDAAHGAPPPPAAGAFLQSQSPKD